MRIAIASADWTKVTGHAGRARHWLLFTVAADGGFGAPDRLELAADDVFHYAEDGRPHRLDGVDALIAASAGDSFLAHMRKRGIDACLTAEPDPAAAVREYLARTLPPPKPRPIGSLVCKAIDLFSKHK